MDVYTSQMLKRTAPPMTNENMTHKQLVTDTVCGSLLMLFSGSGSADTTITCSGRVVVATTESSNNSTGSFLWFFFRFSLKDGCPLDDGGSGWILMVEGITSSILNVLLLLLGHL